jgi:hypothetical protein
MPIAAMATAPTDPIYAVIEAHRHAYKEFNAACGRETELSPEAYSELTGLWAERCDELARQMIDNPPKTIAGTAALLRYVAETVPDNDAYWPPSFWHKGRLCGALASSLARIAEAQG